MGKGESLSFSWIVADRIPTVLDFRYVGRVRRPETPLHTLTLLVKPTTQLDILSCLLKKRILKTQKLNHSLLRLKSLRLG